MLSSTIEKRKTVHNYEQATQEMKVLDSDVDGINVTVTALP
jgi:hypothetical protein